MMCQINKHGHNCEALDYYIRWHINYCNEDKNTASTLCNPCQYEYNCTKCKEERVVLDEIIFRLWQVGWLDKLEDVRQRMKGR